MQKDEPLLSSHISHEIAQVLGTVTVHSHQALGEIIGGEGDHTSIRNLKDIMAPWTPQWWFFCWKEGKHKHTKKNSKKEREDGPASVHTVHVGDMRLS